MMFIPRWYQKVNRAAIPLLVACQWLTISSHLIIVLRRRPSSPSVITVVACSIHAGESSLEMDRHPSRLHATYPRGYKRYAQDYRTYGRINHVQYLPGTRAITNELGNRGRQRTRQQRRLARHSAFVLPHQVVSTTPSTGMSCRTGSVAAIELCLGTSGSKQTTKS